MTIRKLLILPIVVLIVALSVISVTTLSAKEEGATSSAATPFASKVANMLGMDEVKVSQVIEQAKSELQTERISKKLSRMVERGELTQQEADQKLAGLASDSRANGGAWDNDKMRYAKADHARKNGLRRKLTGSREGVEERIQRMVEAGELTQQEADEKLADLASDFKTDGGVWAKDKLRYAGSSHAWEKDFRKKLIGDREGIEERISQMVEKGILTEDEADRKLDALTAKLSAR
ncbi:MAG: hypothetical protein VX800_01620 [Chloroflexota bacterium]|nr:hypothetical protein [Chloroflexota bacterium]